MNNKAVGNYGEDLAETYLKNLGFEILERNWRHQYIEIDIIAHLHNILHFVEVKTRRSSAFGQPEEAVTNKKMAQLKKGAEEYQYRHAQRKKIQFDVLAIRLYENGEVQYWLNKDVYF